MEAAIFIFAVVVFAMWWKAMKDIVERLRLQPWDIGGPSRMDMLRERAEASDEIERLRSEVVDLKASYDSAWAANERLNAACARMTRERAEVAAQVAAAREQGRREGIEAAATVCDRIADEVRSHSPDNHTAEGAAFDAAIAIRALPEAGR